jgi:SecD/SecF fusion protein
MIGLCSVIVFMLLYYLRAGFIANISLAINIILLIGILAIFKFTLTLPGVAGIILTVGIAVDANVLIYERIREELKKGKPLFAAVDAGFSRAFTTIIDANVTTLITALVLAKLGTGPIQGFGITLSAGIVTSVFSAVVVSRLIFDVLLKNPKFNKLTMLSIVRQTRFDFLKLKWPAFALSGALIIGGILVAVKHQDHIYGVDFAGGDSLTMKFTQKVDVSNVRKTLETVGIKECFIQYQKELQHGHEILSMKVPYEKGLDAEGALQKAYPQSNFTVLQMDKVGPSVGKELQWTALKGLLVAAICIVVYITVRFEFAYAVGTLIALFHDVAICLALFFFTDRQLSLPAIGALLTIAGYSLNDTIVVFDRIREELRLKGEKFGFNQLINLSVNETLSRTLLTSLTTLLASIALFVFGGGVINDFAFILVVGVITGTYSSVFIASPVLLLWHPSKLSPQEADATNSTKPAELVS